MTQANDNLLVRQHERVQCRLNARIVPAADHADQLRLARTVGDGTGGVAAMVTDCSGGGIGLRSSAFFPKHALLAVRVSGAREAVVFEGTLRVQRVAMVGREPLYDLGGAFTQSAGELGPRLSALMDEARNSPALPEANPGA